MLSISHAIQWFSTVGTIGAISLILVSILIQGFKMNFDPVTFLTASKEEKLFMSKSARIIQRVLWEIVVLFLLIIYLLFVSEMGIMDHFIYTYVVNSAMLFFVFVSVFLIYLSFLVLSRVRKWYFK